MDDLSQIKKLSSSLKQIRRMEKIDREQTYKLLGVKWYGKGVFVREEKKAKK